MHFNSTLRFLAVFVNMQWVVGLPAFHQPYIPAMFLFRHSDIIKAIASNRHITASMQTDTGAGLVPAAPVPSPSPRTPVAAAWSAGRRRPALTRPG